MIKKDLIEFPCIKISHYFPNLYQPSGGDFNVTVDLSNYAKKTDLRNASGTDTFKLAAKYSLKPEVDEIDIDKLKPVPTDLSKLS